MSQQEFARLERRAEQEAAKNAAAMAKVEKLEKRTTGQLELAPKQAGEAPMKQLAPFDPFKAQIEKLKATAETLTVTRVEQKAEMAIARATRLALRDVRLAIEHRRKELGEHHLRETQRINADAKTLKDQIEPLEARLLDQEQFAEREKERLYQERRTARHAELSPFVIGPIAVDLGPMPDAEYAAMLADFRAAHKARLDREAKEKADADAKAKADKRRHERAILVAPLRDFISAEILGEVPDMDDLLFTALIEKAQIAKRVDEKEREKQRLDNLRLGLSAARERQISVFTLAASVTRPDDLGAMEAEAFADLLAEFREAHATEERRLKKEAADKAAKEEQDRKEADAKRQMTAASEREIAKCHLAAGIARPTDLGEMSDADFEQLRKKFVDAHNAAADAQEALRTQNEAKAKADKEAADTKAEKERDARKKAEDELAAKKKADDDAEKARQAAEKKAAEAPDHAKLKALADSIEAKLAAVEMATQPGKRSLDEIREAGETFVALIRRRVEAL